MSLLTNPQITTVACTLADLLQDRQYALRGTSSLVLQGFEMKVDDVDIVCDEGTALATNTILKSYVVEPVKFSETAQFRSFYGKFIIMGVPVEVMGNWQIKNDKGIWSEIFDGKSIIELDLSGHRVHLTPVGVELKMFLYMSRWNAYHKIKSQFEARNPKDSLNKPQPSLL